MYPALLCLRLKLNSALKMPIKAQMRNAILTQKPIILLIHYLYFQLSAISVGELNTRPSMFQCLLLKIIFRSKYPLEWIAAAQNKCLSKLLLPEFCINGDHLKKLNENIEENWYCLLGIFMQFLFLVIV